MGDFERLVVEEDSAKKRADVFICERFDNFSRSFVHKLFLQGNVLINGVEASKHHKLKYSDEVFIKFPEPKKFELLKENIPLDIVYEDSYLLVVNKKRGMVVHPAPGNFNSTLVNALMWHCDGNLSLIGGVLRPGIVHRIDKNTTGLLVVAKTDDVYKSLCEQIKGHNIKRIYFAIVHGKLKKKSGIINMPIGRSLKDRKKMAVNLTNGKEAITNYEVLEEYRNFSYLKIRLETGRTHQIRVHMAYIKHPIAGDDLYGVKSDLALKSLRSGQCLHAGELYFYHSALKKYVSFYANPDEYFSSFLNKCQNDI